MNPHKRLFTRRTPAFVPSRKGVVRGHKAAGYLSHSRKTDRRHRPAAVGSAARAGGLTLPSGLCVQQFKSAALALARMSPTTIWMKSRRRISLDGILGRWANRRENIGAFAPVGARLLLPPRWALARLHQAHNVRVRVQIEPSVPRIYAQIPLATSIRSAAIGVGSRHFHGRAMVRFQLV
jgi:hypothetical protein